MSRDGDPTQVIEIHSHEPIRLTVDGLDMGRGKLCVESLERMGPQVWKINVRFKTAEDRR